MDLHLFVLANATDETRAGERGVSPFELREMLSGDGTCDLGQIPRVVLWRSGWVLLHGACFKNQGEEGKAPLR